MSRVTRKFYELIGMRNTNKVKRFTSGLKKEVKEELSLNSKFHNIHQNERCFIVGSGPSVSKIDFKKLANEYTFTVNQFSRFDNFQDLKTNYHVLTDERIFKLDENKEEDLERLKYFEKLKDSSNDIQCFAKLSAKDYIEHSKYLKDLNINYILDGLTFHDGYSLGFDITKQIPWFPTVIDYCIFIAMYMGFKEIYLLGCECTGFLRVSSIGDNKDNNNFYYGYKISKNEEVKLKKHLDIYGVADELEIWGKIFRYYEYFERLARENNIKIINSTDGGILYTFERKDLDKVLKEKSKKQKGD